MPKLAVISLFMGQTKNRFLQYGDAVGIADILDRVGRAEGCDGIELRYPIDFGDLQVLQDGLDRNNVEIAAINFASVRNDRWLRGAWTAEDREDRREAIDDFKRCIDIATEIGAPRITNCPLNDGIDYTFELDLPRAYDTAAECYAEIAAHNPDFPICIEYKISEPRVRSLLGTAGETAAFCQTVGADNLGVTLDIGHAMMANENGAQAAALLARAKRLFYVHLNDNDGRADWDLLPGAVHTWELVEFLYTLRELGYDDWMTFDIVPKEHDPVKTFATAARLTRKLEEISERVDKQKMQSLFVRRDPAETMDYLYSLL